MTLADCPNKPNCVSTRASRTEQQIPPILFRCSASEALDRVADLIGSYPRTRIVEQRADYLHATFRSLVFRFTDDVEFEIDAGNRQLHFRSASRVGYSDMGANRKRMQQITSDLLRSEDFEMVTGQVDQ